MITLELRWVIFLGPCPSQPIIAETKREEFEIPPGTEKSQPGPRFLPGGICRSREGFDGTRIIAPGKSQLLVSAIIGCHLIVTVDLPALQDDTRP